MTDEEIKKIARRFELDMYPTMPDMLSAKAMLEWLCKDHCIVPKVEILNQHAWYIQRMKEVSSNRQMNRGKAIALENLFGREMFEEDKK